MPGKIHRVICYISPEDRVVQIPIDIVLELHCAPDEIRAHLAVRLVQTLDMRCIRSHVQNPVLRPSRISCDGAGGR
jgi:hypothetical protein